MNGMLPSAIFEHVWNGPNKLCAETYNAPGSKTTSWSKEAIFGLLSVLVVVFFSTLGLATKYRLHERFRLRARARKGMTTTHRYW